MTLDDLTFSLDQASFDPAARPERTARELLKEIHFLADERFWQYTPAQLRHFHVRLLDWLRNRSYSVDELRTLLELVPAIQFVDREDMASLYRAAFRGPIGRWIADDSQWPIGHFLGAAQNQVNQGIAETWFCPVTDSMDIGQFLRVNQLAGAGARPPWKVLATFGDFGRVREFVARKGYRRLVLLEDFVGSGTQAGRAVKCALEELNGLPVIFVPLIASQRGVRKYGAMLKKHEHFSFEPVFTIPRRMHLFSEPQHDEPQLFQRLREIALQTHQQVRQHQDGDNEQPRHPLGFSRSYGLLFVQYMNCPNNTLPLIWRDGQAWSALFPRIARW
ncbi:MAG: hypothetical protein OXH52_05965 [Gammaproteobacteria bacterium]|nr:hypothetical protein [Gammaproteobacteria bacterium]